MAVRKECVMRQGVWWLLIVTGLGGFAHAAEPEKPVAAMQATVTLVLTEKAYDLEKPSRTRLKCLIRNGGKDAVDIPVGYDGQAVMLHSGVMTLERAFQQRAKPDAAEPAVKFLRLEPGAEATVFDFSVDAIVLKGTKARDAWRWDWPRRSAPPSSPLYPYAGVIEQLMFQAEVKLGEQRVLSNFAVLKVKRRTPPPKTQHDITEAD
jgi:hypothetical protein